MKIKLKNMDKNSLIFLFFFVAIFTANAQKGINFSKHYGAGGKMLMNLDSSAKNVFYDNVFPNQPRTSFNFLPEISQVNIQIYFRKTDSVQNYRYTIIENSKSVVVNKSINEAQLQEVNRGDEEILRSTSFGTFLVKNKIITILTYDIQKAQDVYTTIFFGKSIPKAKIAAIGKRFVVEGGVDYKYIINPKDRTDLVLNEKDDELTIVKVKSDLDFLYDISVKDRQTGIIIYKSPVWQYGGHVNEAHEFSSYVQIDKNLFKKSGDYEIIIQPSISWTNSPDQNLSPIEIEKYISRYTLAITLDDERYTKKEFFKYTLIIASALGFIFLIILYFNKKRNNRKLANNEQQKNIAKLQLNSVRSQLNPHFLFNALLTNFFVIIHFIK
jgi:hypothetical protein